MIMEDIYDIYFQVYDEDDNLVTEIQVFPDMDSWVIDTNNDHRVITSVNKDPDANYYEEEIDDDVMEDNDSLVDGMLDYLDKHNRNTGY